MPAPLRPRSGEDAILRSSVLHSIVVGFGLLVLTACGSGEPDPAVGEDAAAAASASEGPVELVPLSPVGEVVLADGFTFAWELPAGAEGGNWRIVVSAGGSRALWESSRMTLTEFEAPPALLLKLQAGRAYSWRVAGTLDSGGRGRGPATRFIAR